MSTLKLRLKRIDPVKYAIITAVLTALLSLIILVPFTLFFSAIGAAASDLGGGAAIFGGGIFMVIFVPIVYGVIGFIVGLISTMLLNFVLRKTGGLDIDFEKVGMDLNQESDSFLNERN